ncbi:MAG: hypothetical protein Q9227_008867 [Pyrenula ochraceoflavens]
MHFRDGVKIAKQLNVCTYCAFRYRSHCPLFDATPHARHVRGLHISLGKSRPPGAAAVAQEDDADGPTPPSTNSTDTPRYQRSSLPDRKLWGPRNRDGGTIRYGPGTSTPSSGTSSTVQLNGLRSSVSSNYKERNANSSVSQEKVSTQSLPSRPTGNARQVLPEGIRRAQPSLPRNPALEHPVPQRKLDDFTQSAKNVGTTASSDGDGVDRSIGGKGPAENSIREKQKPLPDTEDSWGSLSGDDEPAFDFEALSSKKSILATNGQSTDPKLSPSSQATNNTPHPFPQNTSSESQNRITPAAQNSSVGSGLEQIQQWSNFESNRPQSQRGNTSHKPVGGSAGDIQNSFHGNKHATIRDRKDSDINTISLDGQQSQNRPQEDSIRRSGSVQADSHPETASSFKLKQEGSQPNVDPEPRSSFYNPFKFSTPLPHESGPKDRSRDQSRLANEPLEKSPYRSRESRSAGAKWEIETPRANRSRDRGNFPLVAEQAPAVRKGTLARSPADFADEMSIRRADKAASTPSPRRKARSVERARDHDDFEDFEEGRGRKKKAKKAQKQSHLAFAPIVLPPFISVERLAQALRIELDRFLIKLQELGYEDPAYDNILDFENSSIISQEFNFEPQAAEAEFQDLEARPPPDPAMLPSLPHRPPIVTIMGHVDHGKTTILDWLRKTSVAANEHGGITQHIGAFSVRMPDSDKTITFLDTPGHAAFLDMRRRGAIVTDIVVLVVAADDSVKPQTIEAIKHARESNVTLIVAINKVDKEDANIERVKQDLAREGVDVESYGGETQAIPVSGKTGQGMLDLEEAVIAESENLPTQVEFDGLVEGWIIEASMTNGGRVATVLVRRGTLKPGDIVVAGKTWSRVRSLRNEAGLAVKSAPPGTPIVVDGWREQPEAGAEVLQADSEERAKDVVEHRKERDEQSTLAQDAAAINETRRRDAEARAQVLAWEKENWAGIVRARQPKDNVGWVESKFDQDGGPKRVDIVVKADVGGSVEAVVNAVSSIRNNEIAANVIDAKIGPVNESDIQYLSATGNPSYIVTFNQGVDGSMLGRAEAAGLEILNHNIIYKVTDDLVSKFGDLLPPKITPRVHGEAEIGEIFSISQKRGLDLKIAGCKVTNGSITRDRKIKVLRNKETMYTGMLDSLKHLKKDITEARNGTECGMGFDGWNDFRVGDQIQSFDEKSEKRQFFM